MNQPQDTAGYVNLKYIVSTVMMERSIDDRGYEKLLQLAMNGYAELNIAAIVPNARVEYLTVSEQNTVKFPKDYIDYILIGINSGGRIWTLTRNRNLVKPANMECGAWYRNPITTTANSIGQSREPVDAYSFSDHEYAGQTVSGQYAIGGGFNVAYYNIDARNGQIIFLTDNFSGMTVILEYISSGLNKDTLIPRDAVEALTSFVHFKLDKFDVNVPMNQKLLSQSMWRNERDKLYARRNSFTMNEFLDEKYVTLSQGLKR